MIKLGKRGDWDMPVWLIWMLIALLAALAIIGLSSGKFTEFLRAIGNIFTPS